MTIKGKTLIMLLSIFLLYLAIFHFVFVKYIYPTTNLTNTVIIENKIEEIKNIINTDNILIDGLINDIINYKQFENIKEFNHYNRHLSTIFDFTFTNINGSTIKLIPTLVNTYDISNLKINDLNKSLDIININNDFYLYKNNILEIDNTMIETIYGKKISESYILDDQEMILKDIKIIDNNISQDNLNKLIEIDKYNYSYIFQIYDESRKDYKIQIELTLYISKLLNGMTMLLALLILMFIIIVLFIIYAFIEGYVLKNVKKVTNLFANIMKDDNLNRSLSYSDNLKDEFNSLSRNINITLKKLNMKNINMNRQREELLTINDNIGNLILKVVIADNDNIFINFINNDIFLFNILGLDKKVVQGRSLNKIMTNQNNDIILNAIKEKKYNEDIVIKEEINNHIYSFKVNIHNIMDNDNEYILVFTDVTDLEEHKEILSIKLKSQQALSDIIKEFTKPNIKIDNILKKIIENNHTCNSIYLYEIIDEQLEINLLNKYIKNEEKHLSLPDKLELKELRWVIGSLEKDSFINKLDVSKTDDPNIKKLFIEKGVNSILAFPIFDKDNNFTHFILIENYRNRYCSDELIYLLKNITQLFENYLSKLKLQNELKEKEKQDKLIYYISQQLFNFVNVTEDQKIEVLNKINEVFKSDTVGFYRFNENTNEQTDHLFTISSDLHKKGIQPTKYVPLLKKIFNSKGKDADILFIDKKYLISHTKHDNDYIEEFAKQYDIGEFSMIPIYINEGIIDKFFGFFYMIYKKDNPNRLNLVDKNTLSFIKEMFIAYFTNVELYEYRKNLLNSFVSSVFVIDYKGFYKYANVAPIDGEKRDDEEILTKHLYDYFSKKTADIMLKIGNEVIKNDKAKEYIYQSFNYKKNKTDTYKGYFSKLSDTEFICVAQNITEYIEKEEELKEHKNLYLNTIEAIPSAIIILNNNFNIKLINNTFLKLLYETHHEEISYDVIGTNFKSILYEYVPDEEADELMHKLSNLLINKQDLTNKIKKITIKENPYYLDISIYFISNNNILILIENKTDIYSLKKQLTSSQNTNKHIIQNINNTFIRVNKYYIMKNYYYTPNNLFNDENILKTNMGSNISNIFNDALFKVIRNNIDTVIETKNNVHFKYDLFNLKLKKQVYFNFVMSYVEEDECVIIINDITHEINYLNLLERKKNEYIHFMQDNPQSIIEINGEGIIKYMNHSFVSLLNLDYNKDTTYNIFDFIVKNDNQIFDDILYNCQRNNQSGETNQIIRLINKNKEIKTLLYCVNTNLENDLFTLIFIDITNYNDKLDNIYDLIYYNSTQFITKEIIFEYNMDEDKHIVFSMGNYTLEFLNIKKEEYEKNEIHIEQLIDKKDMDRFYNDIKQFEINNKQVIKTNYNLLINGTLKETSVYLMAIVDNDVIYGIKMIVI